MGASNGNLRFSVIRPNYVDQTIRLLRGRPPEDMVCYLLIAARELQAVGKLTPAMQDRLSKLAQRAMRLDRAA